MLVVTEWNEDQKHGDDCSSFLSGSFAQLLAR